MQVRMLMLMQVRVRVQVQGQMQTRMQKPNLVRILKLMGHLRRDYLHSLY
jgi:hypothetical protein